MLLPADLRQRLTPDFVSCLPPEIKREVLQLLEERRALAIRQSFIEWCRHCGFEPAAHHRLLISELEKVARGETVRLAIFMPPGSAKSTYASVLFPPWLLANANCNILAASHTTELDRSWRDGAAGDLHAAGVGEIDLCQCSVSAVAAGECEL